MTEPMPYIPPDQPSEAFSEPSAEPFAARYADPPPAPYSEPYLPSYSAGVESDPTGPTPPPSATRRPWLVPVAAGVAGLAVGALVTAALTSGGSSNSAAAAIAGSSTSTGAPATGTNGAGGKTGAGGQAGGNGAQAPRVRGVITAENGSSWTVRSAAGPSVIVTISRTTKFGTKKAPATQSQFIASSAVVIVGKRTGDTVTAKRVIMSPAAGRTKASPSALPTS